EDPGRDHAVTSNAEDERRVLPDEVPGEREDVFHVLLGEERLAGGDPTQDRHVDDAFGRLARPVFEDLDRPGLAGIPMDEPLFLKGGEMAVDRRTAREPKRRPYLADRRRIAPLLHVRHHVGQDLTLALRQSLTHSFAPHSSPVSVTRRPGL